MVLGRLKKNDAVKDKCDADQGPPTMKPILDADTDAGDY
jgi:hypothetical protein